MEQLEGLYSVMDGCWIFDSFYRSSIFPMTVHHTGAMAIDKNAAAAAATTGQSGQSLYENCDR